MTQRATTNYTSKALQMERTKAKMGGKLQNGNGPLFCHIQIYGSGKHAVGYSQSHYLFHGNTQCKWSHKPYAHGPHTTSILKYNTNTN